MDNKKLQINQAKLTPEQRDRLEAYQQTQDQLRTLQDIADMTQEVINVLDSQRQGDETNDKQMGALLMDMRDSLTALRDKELPESPDYAKPVVEAVDKLEKSISAAIKSIDVKPVIDAPQVNVNPPHVDLKGVEKAVGAIPGAFAEAIKLIEIPEVPETNFQPLLDAWEGISEQLVSIENATRMKPLPGSMAISNLDEVTAIMPQGLLAGIIYDDIVLSNEDANSNPRTATVKLNSAVVRVIKMTYNSESKLTRIYVDS